MSLLIRRADSGDAATLADFQILMAKETENKQLDRDIVLPAVNAVFADESKGFYLVAELDSNVVGGLLITYEWSDWRNCNIWYIQSVYVADAHRGKGVFKQLYHRVLELAKQDGSMFVRLYVEVENTLAQKTYESLGMKRMPYYLYDVKID